MQKTKIYLANLLQKFKEWYKKAPDSKKYIELLTAILSVPVMITVIVLNLNNLNQNKQAQNTTNNKTTPIEIVISAPAQKPPNNENSRSATPTIISTTPTSTPTPSPTPTNFECKKEVGPIEVLTPQEGQVINTDNLCIKISTNSNYCPITLSYQLDGGNWSDFTTNSVCLYNLPSGNRELQLKIKSTASDDLVTLKRNFIYQNPKITSTPTPSPTPTN